MLNPQGSLVLAVGHHEEALIRPGSRLANISYASSSESFNPVGPGFGLTPCSFSIAPGRCCSRAPQQHRIVPAPSSWWRTPHASLWSVGTF